MTTQARFTKSSEQSTQQYPWYKQFWPWFLIVLPTTVVIASFMTLYIAITHADTPVQDDYVRHGLTVLHKPDAKADEAQRSR